MLQGKRTTRGPRRRRQTARKISRRRFAETEPGQTEPVSRFHKLDPHGVCNTLRAGTNTDRGAFTSPRPIHYLYNRCITVREAARLLANAERPVIVADRAARTTPETAPRTRRQGFPRAPFTTFRCCDRGVEHL